MAEFNDRRPAAKSRRAAPPAPTAQRIEGGQVAGRINRDDAWAIMHGDKPKPSTSRKKAK